MGTERRKVQCADSDVPEEGELLSELDDGDSHGWIAQLYLVWCRAPLHRCMLFVGTPLLRAQCEQPCPATHTCPFLGLADGQAPRHDGTREAP